MFCRSVELAARTVSPTTCACHLPTTMGIVRALGQSANCAIWRLMSWNRQALTLCSIASGGRGEFQGGGGTTGTHKGFDIWFKTKVNELVLLDAGASDVSLVRNFACLSVGILKLS
eukprot:s4198_g9.t1